MDSPLRMTEEEFRKQVEAILTRAYYPSCKLSKLLGLLSTHFAVHTVTISSEFVWVVTKGEMEYEVSQYNVEVGKFILIVYSYVALNNPSNTFVEVYSRFPGVSIPE